MRGWLPALRIARREARKAKGRSGLVLAMIGLPVAFLAFAAVTFDMFTLTPEERLDRRIGAADAHLMWAGDGEVRQTPDGSEWSMRALPGIGGAEDPEEQTTPTEADILALLPTGTRAVTVGENSIKVRTPDGIGNAQNRSADASDPMQRGMIELLEGRAAKAADEIVINEAAAEWLGVRVGGTVDAVGPDRSYRVTGIVEFPDRLAPGLSTPSTTGKGRNWLVDTPGPVDWEQVKRLNQRGIVVISRAVALGPTPPDAAAYYDAYQGPGVADELAMGVLVAGLAMLEIILLAGPAFAVGARRRSRDLALVAAAGGEPKQLRRIVLADGVVLGLAGAVAGLALGVIAAFLGRPLIEEYLAGERAGGYRIFPLALAGIAGLSVVTGLLAALVPAFTAARQPVALALAGRRGIMRSRKRWVFVGLALAVVGAVVATLGAMQFAETVMLGGVIIGELGLVLVTPALIGLVARLGRWLPLSSRLALRDTARNRASAAPAISAVMAAVAGAVAAGVVFGANHEQAVATYQPRLPHGYVAVEHYVDPGAASLDWAQAEAEVRGVLPDAQVHRFMRGQSLIPVTPPERECPLSEMDRRPTAEEQQAMRADERCRRSPRDWGLGVVVDDGSALTAFTGITDPERIAKAREVLARGGAVVNDEWLVKDGRVVLQDPRTEKTLTVEGYFIGEQPGFTVMLSPTAPVENPRVAGLIVRTFAVPAMAEEERLNLAMRRLDADIWITVERGPAESDPTGLLFAVVAALIALAAAGIATGLAAADSCGDLATLAAVGAEPRVRRRLSLSQAGVISGLGALLGSVTGLGTAAVFILALNRFEQQSFSSVPPPMPFVVPWDVVAVVVAVPLLAMLGAGLLTRSRLPIERRL